jgi:arylsulfatase I/J
MTGLAENLKAAGYKTAMAGKWDAGMATPQHTPHGRGYDTSLNYFSHKVGVRCPPHASRADCASHALQNDFWSQANMQTCCEKDQTIIDFWHTDQGASDVNSTDYSEFLYQTELLAAIERHDASDAEAPLMLFYAPHVAHCPLQVPKRYYDKFGFMTDDESKCSAQTVKGLHSIDPHFPELEYKCRQQYHAMVSIMDDVVGNLTTALKAKGMWENTLVIFSSDNG